MRSSSFIAGLALPLLVAVIASAWQADARRICEDESRVPFLIVKGIVQVESEGHPYVLNVKIGSVWRSYKFSHAVNAKVVLTEALKHTQQIDIGLMQVHWAEWKDDYPVEATDLLNLPTNLQVGCDILRRELAGEGPLWQRIGRYHSRTPELNQHYALKVLRAALSP